MKKDCVQFARAAAVKKRLQTIAAVLCLCLLPLLAHASNVELKLIPGYNFRMTTFNQPADTMSDGGFSFYLQALYKAAPDLKIGLEAGHSVIYEATYRELIISSPNFYFNNKYIATATPFNAVIRYEFLKGERFAPFFQAAFGSAAYSFESRTNWGTFAASKSFFNYALGIGTAITTGTFFTVEPSLRYHVITSDGNNVEMVTIGMGIGF